jgi:hypothetical protein
LLPPPDSKEQKRPAVKPLRKSGVCISRKGGVPIAHKRGVLNTWVGESGGISKDTTSQHHPVHKLLFRAFGPEYTMLHEHLTHSQESVASDCTVALTKVIGFRRGGISKVEDTKIRLYVSLLNVCDDTMR